MGSDQETDPASSDTKSDVERHAKEGDRHLEEENRIAESLEGDTAEVVAVTTRGRVEVPSRYSSKTQTQEKRESKLDKKGHPG